MGDLFHFALHRQLVAEFCNILAGSKRRNRVIEFFDEETVASPDLFLVNIRSLSNLVKCSGQPALSAGQVKCG